MGIFRLVLALVVAMSHMGFRAFNSNPGVTAVISFFLISGYVVSALIYKYYLSPKYLINFYADRLIRIYPQFIFYFLLACLIIKLGLPNSDISHSVNPQNILSSATILPLGMYMFGWATADIIPPAWSLGLELAFYLTIPILIFYSVRRLAFLLSLTVFLAANFGYIDTDTYGYRLLPGVLFMFLCGSFLYSGDKLEKGLVVFTLFVCITLFSLIVTGDIQQVPYNLEVLLGIIIAIPSVYLLSKVGYHKIDELFGNISYGVFLNHFLLVHAANAIGFNEFGQLMMVGMLGVSIALSYASYSLIERPALRLRHKMRKASGHIQQRI